MSFAEIGGSTWRKINDYLMEVESAENRPALLDVAIRRVETIIPFDSGAGLLDSSLRIMCGYGVPESTIDVYNEYYRFKMPSIRYGSYGEYSTLRNLEVSGTTWGTYSLMGLLR